MGVCSWRQLIIFLSTAISHLELFIQGWNHVEFPLPALVYQMVLSYLLALLKQPADGDRYKDTQLVKMQNIIDCGVPSPKWYICNATSTSKVQEKSWKNGWKDNKSQTLRMSVGLPWKIHLWTFNNKEAFFEWILETGRLNPSQDQECKDFNSFKIFYLEKRALGAPCLYKAI